MARRSKKVKYNNIMFDSETECEFYKILELKKKNKEIKDFKYEPFYELQEGGWTNKRGDKQEPINYFPDFLISPLQGDDFLIDTKGGDIHEPECMIKKKMLEYQNRDIILYFVSKTPVFLGSEWIETTAHRNMLQKLRLSYKKEYPKVGRKTKASPKLDRNKWGKYMEVRSVEGLFYTYDKYYTKKDLANKKK
jgi:hypothetical protein